MHTPPTLTATTPCLLPPNWAVWERRLLDVLSTAVHPFLERYTRPDGSLIWADAWPAGVRDGVDDFYESSVNWPLLYLLGGAADLLPIAQRQWDVITRQLTDFGVLRHEYEIGYDQFHQSEHYTYFYLLCRADAAHAVNRARAARFAGFYTGDDPDAPNYDPVLRIIRAPHNGSGGPRWGFLDDPDVIADQWSETMRPYGLPFHDVPGISTYDDLRDPVLARRMADVMQHRHGRGDVATNLLVTSLLTNAYLLTGDPRYRTWVLDYVEAWIARAAQNGGRLPDNIGLDGRIGADLDGRWYGGLYGWAWPHGFYNISMAAVAAGTNAYLLSGDTRYLDLPRSQYDRMLELGVYKPLEAITPAAQFSYSLPDTAAADTPRFVIPFRYSDQGWFDYQPVLANPLVVLWGVSGAAEDWARLEQLRAAEGHDWRRVEQFRTKEDSGHERPWLRFLAGELPEYPELILRQSHGILSRRLEQIRNDRADLAQVNIHHWQEHNPITTEALVQLTLGAPQPIYNGGLLHTPLAYSDPIAARPGLPPDIAALVSRVTAATVQVELVNLAPFSQREVIVHAGMFNEHRFTSARTGAETHSFDADRLRIILPPAARQRSP